MCNRECLRFIEQNLSLDEVANKRVLESGAQNLNGSARAYVSTLAPLTYVGTDIQPGQGVDQICDAVDLIEKFGEGSFDVLISTEVVEHVRDWRTTISNYKRILCPGGVLVITTRSVGFPYHLYPLDCWRYDVNDMAEIFADFEIQIVQPDPFEPGVFVKARRPLNFVERDLSDYALYYMPGQARRVDIP